MDQNLAMRRARANERAQQSAQEASRECARRAELARKATLQKELEVEIQQTLNLLEEADLPGVRVVSCYRSRRSRFTSRYSSKDFTRPGWEIFTWQVRSTGRDESMRTESTCLLADGHITIRGSVMTAAELVGSGRSSEIEGTRKGLQDLRRKLMSHNVRGVSLV